MCSSCQNDSTESSLQMSIIYNTDFTRPLVDILSSSPFIVLLALHSSSQEYDSKERSIHEYSLRGMYRDGAVLLSSSFLTKEWWISRRFFWERGLNEIPHCVVFVFDGSSDPFLDPESLEFFQTVFKDCTDLGKL